jgi:endonuclease YncB( thermonuclease family)
MSTWLNRGASGGPCGELTEEDQTPSRSDSHQPASTKAGVVHSSVGDGDTVTVAGVEQGAVRVRLAGIDAPEIGQPYGDAARRRLADLVLGQTVNVFWHKRDRYGRLVGRVEVNDVDAGIALLNAGLAWHFKAYQHEQAPEERDRYAHAESTARGERRGLWLEIAPLAPWSYRAFKRTNPVPVPTPPSIQPL